MVLTECKVSNYLLVCILCLRFELNWIQLLILCCAELCALRVDAV